MSSGLERSLAQQVRAGNPDAFSALFHALYPSLCTVAARRIGSDEAAEDLVQEVFVRVWERRATLDPEQSVTRYLFRAVRNETLNHLKHRQMMSRTQEHVTIHVHLPGPEEELDYGQLSEAVQEAIEQLPERCREIFLLSRQAEMTYREIAQLLGLSIKTVETQMGRALRALRLALLPYLGE